MDLQSLVDIFGGDVTIKTVTEGQYFNGIWQDGTETQTTIFGVLLNLKFEEVQKITAGEYTVEDVKVIVKENVDISTGDIVVDGSNEYEIKMTLDQSRNGNIKSYVAKKVVG